MSSELHCDCAQQPALKVRELQAGLFAQACEDCGALAIDLDDYRRWLERRTVGPAPEMVAPIAPNKVRRRSSPTIV